MKTVALTLTALLLYAGSYVGMGQPTVDPFIPMRSQPYYTLGPVTEWLSTAANDRVDQAAAFVFTPLHWCDRRLRPTTWE